MLQTIGRRLGWPSLAGKRLLDYGCGVRFARTVVNLDLPLKQYIGVDVARNLIDWLSTNVADSRLRFHHFNMLSVRYNAAGAPVTELEALSRAVATEVDAACMFSVITHTDPSDAEAIFRMLHPCVRSGGQLYFTALTDETVADYFDANPEQPLQFSTYNPDFLIDIVRRAGWSVERIYPPSVFQQTAFVCRR